MSRGLDNVLDGLIAFGRLARSSLSSRVRNVLVTVLGDRDGDGRDERHDEQTIWGLSPVVYRPAPPQGETAEECVFIRRGDEAIIIGTRETRWQVQIDEGEAVVRGLGQNAARIRLKANGDVLIEAGSSVATLKIPLDELIQTELTKIQTTLATGSNGAGPVVFATAYVPGETASKRIKVDA